MKTPVDVQETRERLDSAMELVRQDRWVLGGLRDGRLKVIIDSDPGPARRAHRSRDLSPLARKSLYERKPLTVASVLEPEINARDPYSNWEMEWPALIYAPVGVPRQRPVGLLLVGSRTSHWYPQEEIDYVSALALTLIPTVLAITGPLGRLPQRERRVAQLIGEGMSVTEVASALTLERADAQRIVSKVLGKLNMRSTQELGQLLELPLTHGGVLL